MIGACLSLISAATLGGAFAAPTLARLFPPGKAIVLSAWWIMATVAVIAIDPSTPVIAGGLTMAMLGVPVNDVLLSSYEAPATPDDHMGRLGSVNMFVTTLSIPAGQAIGAMLVAVSGPRAAFAVYAGAILAGALVLSSTKAVRSLQRAKQPAPVSPLPLEADAGTGQVDDEEAVNTGGCILALGRETGTLGGYGRVGRPWGGVGIRPAG